MWRDRCDNMNQWLTESEKLIKNEDKIGTDIDEIQEQMKDNQVGANTVRIISEGGAYEGGRGLSDARLAKLDAT